MRLFIAGPMRGYANCNFPAFYAAAQRLKSAGHEVINPAQLDRFVGFDPDGPLPDGYSEKAIRRNAGFIVRCDAIAVLPGWSQSEGTAKEIAIARLVGLPVLDAMTLEPQEQTSGHSTISTSNSSPAPRE